jgi:hypothetical protein
MKFGRLVLWTLVPISLSLAIASTWATFHFGPIGKPSQSAIRCSEVRAFILDEEVAGKAQWNLYRQQVKDFQILSPSSPNRGEAVAEISMTLIEVLGHDLAIYRELDANISCVKMEKRETIPGLVTETASTINFLNGSEPINGVFFNPALGQWNSDFYAEYASAIDLLKSNADAKSV